MPGAVLEVANYLNKKTITSPGISIGNNSAIGPYCIIYGSSSIDIGDDVLIAARVSIAPISHNYSDTNALIREQGSRSAKGIRIENNVWIGLGVIILDG